MNLVKDIFTYAIRGSGKYLLFTCAVLSVIADLVTFAPLLGFFAWILISAYFCAIYMDLIQSTATGGKEAAEFPEVGDIMGEVIWPWFQVIFVLLVSFAPLILFPLLVGEANSLTILLLSAWGCIYFPMAMLAVVICGTPAAASPIRVIPSILRVGGLYWFSVAMLVGLYFAQVAILEAFNWGFFIEPLIIALISSYVMMTNARILGIIWRERRDELAWI